MADALSRFITNAIQQTNRESAVRFTVVLDHSDNARLEYLAKRFGFTKAGFVRDILKAAMTDFEEQIGVADSSAAYTDYWNEVQEYARNNGQKQGEE